MFRKNSLILIIFIIGLVVVFVLFVVFSGSDSVQSIINRVISTWPWYIVRGSGIIAAISLVILMLSGLGSVTGHTFKLLEPIIAWASHKALGIVFGISILIHMVGLLFDHFVPFSLVNLLLPWTSNYKPVTFFGLHLGSLFVSLGVLAFYAVVLIIITSLLWIDKKPYIWKLIHLLSYIVLVLVFFHALNLGTDIASGFLRWLWIAIGVGGAGLIAYRIWRSKVI